MTKNAYFTLIAYDIPDDKRRTKVMNTLLNYGGIRVNYSVFECLLQKSRLSQIKKDIKKLIKEKEDKVRYYILCDSCLKSIESQGIETESILDEDENVFV